MLHIKAQSLVRELGDLSVPLHLRNAPTALMKELNYRRNYQYSHDHKNELHQQEFMPKEIKGNSIYIKLKIIKKKRNIV